MHKVAKQLKKLKIVGNDGDGDNDGGSSSKSGSSTEYGDLSGYDTDDLREELKKYGKNPIITKTTKRIYVKRLLQYTNGQPTILKHSSNKPNSNFSTELQNTIKEDLQSLDFIDEYVSMEREMITNCQSGVARNTRNGSVKNCFVYLLIDPRKIENCVNRMREGVSAELWCWFLKSIFYVGKGQNSRPYEHLNDAFRFYNSGKDTKEKKLKCIMEIWNANKGVICLQVFHSITSCEAFTREAAIIDCMGLESLTNQKRGTYYGDTKSWTRQKQNKLGVLLLYKAMKVFRIQEENQLRPNDL